MGETGFWEGRRICVTGGGGFLGSFVLEGLRGRGAKDIFVPRQRDYDLVKPDAVRRLIGEVRPDIILHLAAHVGGIGANQAHPAEFFYDNLMMGVQLLHQAWEAGVEKFVAIGTVCAYPKFTPVPFREEDFWDGYPEETNAPYGLAKKMLLVQSQAYRQQYGYNSIYLIPVNLYGPGDNFDLETSHVIPALIRKFIEAREEARPEVVLWGDGSPSREFLFVRDAAEGILLGAEHYNGPDPVNLGAGREVVIRDLASKIAQMTGYEGSIRWDTSRPNGQPRRALNTERAERLFGFRASTDLDQGLQETIQWYEAHRANARG
jgi:GDP-L-fucose synthase